MLDVAAAFEANNHYMMGMAINLVGPSDADDLVQNCWIKVIGAADRYEDDGRLRQWLCTIVHHTAMNHFRSGRYRKTVELTGYDVAAPVSLETVVMDRLALAELKPAIAALTKGERAALTVSLTTEPYKVRMDGRTKTALHRARVRLKALVA